MLVQTAIKLIDQLVYKPGWKLEATDNTKRFENSICLHITYPATNSDRSEAPDYATPIPPNGARAAFNISLRFGWDDIDLYGKVAECIMKIESHEMREFLRVNGTYWAPFHPHNQDGITRWAYVNGIDADIQEAADFTFGLV